LELMAHEVELEKDATDPIFILEPKEGPHDGIDG